jgi:hypothetical protein
MIVGFLHARQDPKYAKKMIESVKKVLPYVDIVQWTDEDTPQIEGCRIVRRSWDRRNPMIFKMNFLAEQDENVLVLDTDVILKADVSSVFALPFDVALTWRDGPIRDPEGNDLTKIMPFNCGVMFSRSSRYWQACLEWCAIHSVDSWYADQLAVANVKGFDVLKLHCDNFNYTPRSQDEDVSGRLAIHYKGKRKEWMLR